MRSTVVHSTSIHQLSGTVEAGTGDERDIVDGRGHNFTLVKKQSILDVRKFSFSQRTINVWNTLSEECVHASSVNMFKNRIDKYLVKAGYK